MQINEYQLRIIVFLLVIGIISILEICFKRRESSLKKRKLSNIILHIFNIIFMRSVVIISAVTVADYGNANHLGLFHRLTLPPELTFILSILILDFLIYFQHYLSHKVSILWRLHSLHHSDPHFDWTTSLRFHPLEIFLSLGYKSFFILLLGISADAIIIFAALLNSMAIFNHGNYKINLKFDSLLRFFIVTPDMHRIHHSIINSEKHSNFGFNLSLWDRMFKTYVRDPEKGYRHMEIGLDSTSKNDPQGVLDYLKWPFKK